MQKHPRQMRPRQFVPALFVASLLLSLALVPLPPVGAWMLVLVLGSYLVANMAATLATARRNGWRLLCRLPAIFAVMHFAYGSGFLVGLIRFCGRWGDSTTRARGVGADLATPPASVQTTL
jgi:hypothetical protein